MATLAKLVLNYSHTNTFTVGATIAFKLKGVTYTFQAVSSGSTPIAASGQYNSVFTLKEAIKAKVGTDYNVFHDGAWEIQVIANNYGSDYDFAPLNQTGTSGLNSFVITENQGTFYSASLAKTDPTNVGASDGTITTTVSGGGTPYSFSWYDGGPNTQNRSGLAAGHYKVQIRDANFVDILPFLEIDLTDPNFPPVAVVGTRTHVLCYGSSTGAISLAVSGGNGGPYTYAWADGPTTQNRAGLAAGNYSVTVTDSVGNAATQGFVINGSPEIVVEATITENDVTLAINGGTGVYTYLWSDGATNRDRTDLEPGIYQVVITDTNACTKEVSVNISRFQFYFSRNPVTLSLQALVPETKANLSFVCEIWIELAYKSEVFTKVVTFEQPADSNGSTVFDAQAVLDAYLNPFLPEGKETVVSRADSIFKRFYFRYTEKYGTPPALATFTQVDTNYLVLGGLSFEEYAAGTFFSSYLATQKPFFTWEPDGKEVFAEQPEYLHFLPNSFTLTSFKCVVKVLYSDGTDGVHVFHTQTGVLRFEVYCIPAGHDQLELTQYSFKTITGWQLWVADPDDTIISEVRTYALRTDYQAYRRYFLYLNSLGCYNTLATTGRAKRTLDPDSQQIERILPANYAISDGAITILSKVGKPALQLSTGYGLSREHLLALQDFLISESVVLVENGRYLPGPVKDKTQAVLQEGDTLDYLDFEFELPKMYHYTPRL
jgi:hypothetical protein